MARETMRHVLHEAGDSSQRTRPWARTGGTVTTDDPETLENTDGLSRRRPDRFKPFPSLAPL